MSKSIRKRVTLIVHDGGGKVLVGRHRKAPKGTPSITFPGGGVEAGQSVDRAAELEAKEEVGIRIKNLRSMGIAPKDVALPNGGKDYKKGQYTHIRQYWRLAQYAGDDKSLLGSEGDALGHRRFVPIPRAISLLEGSATRPNNPSGEFDQQQADALKKVPSLLKSARAPIRDRLLSLFSKEKRRAIQRSDKHHRRDDPEKWDDFIHNVRRKSFAKQIGRDSRSDDRLALHAERLNRLHTGKMLAQVQGSTGVYDIVRLRGGGLGCTCNDWRYRRSVADKGTTDCKHIQQWKALNKSTRARAVLKEAEARTPLSTKERLELTGRLEQAGLPSGCVTGEKREGGYIVRTHRARSKVYPSVRAIPLKTLKFIESTG